MQSPQRALLYGLGVWIGLIGISLILLPLEGQERHQALYESVKLSALVAVTLGLTIVYLGRLAKASLAEGVLVGVIWAAIVIVLDLVLYMLGAFNIGLSAYFTDVASSYIVIPVITTLTMGHLKRR